MLLGGKLTTKSHRSTNLGSPFFKINPEYPTYYDKFNAEESALADDSYFRHRHRRFCLSV